MRQHVVGGICLSIGLLTASPGVAGTDAVLRWNDNAGKAALAACLAPDGNALAEARMYAMVQIAVHDAVNAIHRRSRPYAYDAQAPGGTSSSAAIASAARDVLVAVIGQLQESAECVQRGLSRLPLRSGCRVPGTRNLRPPNINLLRKARVEPIHHRPRHALEQALTDASNHPADIRRRRDLDARAIVLGFERHTCTSVDEPLTTASLDHQRVAVRRTFVLDCDGPFEASRDGRDRHSKFHLVAIRADWFQPLASGQAPPDRVDVHQEIPHALGRCVNVVGRAQLHDADR